MMAIAICLPMLGMAFLRAPLMRSVATQFATLTAPLTGPKVVWKYRVERQADSTTRQIRHVTVAPGVHLEVIDWGGRGQPVVFLAGFGNSAHVFDNFAPRFTDHFHVVGITRRGFGASSLATSGYDSETLARDIIAVLDSLHLVKPILVAHSFGGAELNAIATHHADNARALIYLDAGFDFAELYADTVWLRTPFPKPPTRESELAFSREMAGPNYPESEVRSNADWIAALQRTPAFHADSLAVWLMRGTPPAQLSEIKLPTLAIYGVPATVDQKYPWYARLSPDKKREAERRFAVERERMAHQRSRFHAEVKNSRVIEIAGGRHYVFLTHPRDVARAIRQFVR